VVPSLPTCAFGLFSKECSKFLSQREVVAQVVLLTQELQNTPKSGYDSETLWESFLLVPDKRGTERHIKVCEHLLLICVH